MSAVLIILLVIPAALVLLAVVLLVVPLPPLDGLEPLEKLKDPDSRFIQVNGLDVHYKQRGSGERVLILLHGFGAGVFSWREVMEPFGKTGTVIAYDRPAFGLTARPMPESWQGANPYGPQANLEQLFGLMDALGVAKAVLVGHSAGGRVALHAALERPERFCGLVLVDAAVYAIGRVPPRLLRPLMLTPQANRLGPAAARWLARRRGDQFLRASWHDPEKITPEVYALYRKPFQMADWDRALWEQAKAFYGGDGLGARIAELNVPTLVVTGDDDRIVPTADALRLAAEIRSARLVVIPSCGHVPQEEQPAAFLEALQGFLETLQ